MEPTKLFYRIAETRFDKGYRFVGPGTRPLQDRFPEIMSHSVVYLTAVVTELFRRVPG